MTSEPKYAHLDDPDDACKLLQELIGLELSRKGTWHAKDYVAQYNTKFTAYIHLRDGFVEGFGHSTEHRFSISLSDPDVIEKARKASKLLCYGKEYGQRS